MRKLAIAILVTVWILVLAACLTGEWIDKDGYPVHMGNYTIGDVK